MFLCAFTVLGLWTVHGKMETIKVGYDIRQLNIRKLELTHRMKEAELQIANLTAPDKLQDKMSRFDVKLVNPELKKIARATWDDVPEENSARADEPTLLAKLFLKSAQADTAR
jgi:hypothetical protein